MKKNVNENLISNGGKKSINTQVPYHVTVTLTGTCDYLYHRWNCEAVEAKANAAKNSKAKKTDDIETFVYRNEEGFLCIPGEQVRMSLIHAAKYKQDPRSPRKSAMDLYKAAVIVLTPSASLGIKEWDYEDKRRVVIQRNSINRIRPAIKMGWEATFDFLINTPEYIDPITLHEVLSSAGRLCGLGDFRPSFGRFAVTKFEAY